MGDLHSQVKIIPCSKSTSHLFPWVSCRHFYGRVCFVCFCFVIFTFTMAYYWCSLCPCGLRVPGNPVAVILMPGLAWHVPLFAAQSVHQIPRRPRRKHQHDHGLKKYVAGAGKHGFTSPLHISVQYKAHHVRNIVGSITDHKYY